MTSHDALKLVTRLTAALRGALPLFACMGCSDASLKWTEDVRLPDGRVVTLTRYQEFKGPHEIGETPSASDYWFEFRHPESGRNVRWHSDRDLATLALMMDGSVPELLVTPHFGSSMIRYRCPNPPYLLYRLNNGADWTQIPIHQIPIKRIRVNMTFSPDDERENIKASGHHLTVDDTGSYQRKFRPYIINFELMKQQSFLPSTCGYQLDELLDH